MSRKYKFHNHHSLYFVTFTTIQWIDVFTRDVYRNIFTDSIAYCQQNKALEVYAWVIMTNHVHMIISCSGAPTLSDITRDLKSYTSRQIRLALEQSTTESRQQWMLWMLTKAGIRNPNNIDFQLWQQHSHPVLLDDRYRLFQRLHYLHNNPVKAGFVSEPAHWKWSSAIDYCGGKGIVDIVLVE
jgi:putative transposase